MTLKSLFRTFAIISNVALKYPGQDDFFTTLSRVSYAGVLYDEPLLGIGKSQTEILNFMTISAKIQSTFVVKDLLLCFWRGHFFWQLQYSESVQMIENNSDTCMVQK